MDKRKQANRRVKGKIVDALLALMEEKSYGDISVTDIVNRAGVARQSYYRNFASKEAIVEEFYRGMCQEAMEILREQGDSDDTYTRLTAILTVQKRNREAILRLYRGGFARYMLNMINQNVEHAAGDMPASSPDRYRLYCFSGAIFNTALTWLLEGTRESVEELAKIICSFQASDVVFGDLDELD